MYHYVSPEKIMKRAHECNWIQKHVRSFVFDRSLPSVFRAIRPLTHSTMSNNSSNIEHLPVEIAYTIPSKVRFWLYLLVLVPSTLCSLIVLHHLLFNRAPRRALNNHVIIILLLIGLICQLTIYPWLLYYFSHEGDWARSLLFCSIWGLHRLGSVRDASDGVRLGVHRAPHSDLSRPMDCDAEEASPCSLSSSHLTAALLLDLLRAGVLRPAV